MLKLPEEYLNESHVQGYYGTVSHNTKAVYTKYLGWYDGNPSNLNPLPPVEAGEKYVEYMGGTEELIGKATKAFEEGEYRWVVQVMNHAVFADPTNTKVRNLQADAFEQLGYQSESGTWRNAYLTAARELRYGSLEYPRQWEDKSLMLSQLINCLTWLVFGSTLKNLITGQLVLTGISQI